VLNWRQGDTIPLSRERTLRVLGVRATTTRTPRFVPGRVTLDRLPQIRELAEAQKGRLMAGILELARRGRRSQLKGTVRETPAD
jgi:hypothetical protein